MLHTNMRDLLQQTLIFAKSSDTAPVQAGAVRVSSVVAFDKAPEDPVFVVSDDGEAILAIIKPKTVIVPMAEYDGDEPVQERIVALIQAGSNKKEEWTKPVAAPPAELPVVPAYQAFEFAQLALGKAPYAIVANKNVAARIEEAYGSKVWEENAPKLYQSALLLGDDHAYAVPAPADLGHTVISIPTGKQGLLLHGQVALFRIAASESAPTASGS